MLQSLTKKQKIWMLWKTLLGVSGGLFIAGLAVLSLNTFPHTVEASSTEHKEKIVFTGVKAQYLDQYFSTVHFSVAKNDFWGGIFWLPSEELATPQIIKTKIGGSEQVLTCSSRVRGYYYNSQRGERLWPLDTQSQAELANINGEYKTANLKINGGFFTNCTGLDHLTGVQHALFGKITHMYKTKTFDLHAGLENSIGSNILKGVLKCNLQRVANAYPLGYLYDSQGGIWLVGLTVKPEKMKNNYDEVIRFHLGFTKGLNNNCVDKYFDYSDTGLTNGEDPIQDDNGTINRKDIVDPGVNSDAKTTMMNLGIRWIIWLSTEIDANAQAGILGNPQKTSLLVSTENSIASTINAATKKAEALCRNKRGNSKSSDTIICIKWRDIARDAKALAWKTIILSGGNLTVNWYMDANSQPTTVFINKGKLILTWTPQSNLVEFAPNGYIAKAPNDPTNIQALYLKGNFIINGILTTNSSTGVENRLVIHGKLASFNTIDKPNTTMRTKLINDKLKNITISSNEKIWLREIFTWSCGLSGVWSDGTSCQGSKNAWNSTTLFLTDKAFGLIDMTFPSPLFQ